MPRPRRKPSAPSLSAGQAQYVLQRILADRKVSASDVSRYVGDMQREISELEQRLASLRAATGGAAAAAPTRAAAPRGRRRAGRGSAAVARSSTARPARRRRSGSAVTPEVLASRQLQGRYLGLIRQIPQSRRAQYKKIAQERGREAAIREIQSALKK